MGSATAVPRPSPATRSAVTRADAILYLAVQRLIKQPPEHLDTSTVPQGCVSRGSEPTRDPMLTGIEARSVLQLRFLKDDRHDQYDYCRSS
jgi:hypothetical protein